MTQRRKLTCEVHGAKRKWRPNFSEARNDGLKCHTQEVHLLSSTGCAKTSAILVLGADHSRKDKFAGRFLA